VSSSADFLDLLLSATNDGYVDWDLVAGTVTYSPRWKTLLGYEPHELGDHPDLWRQMSHPEDLARADELFRDHLEEMWPLSHRWRMRHRNGDWRWVLCRAATIRDDDARPVRMVSVYTDVTEQVRTEERYRALANGTPDTILRIRADGLILDEKPAAVPISLIDDSDMGRMLLECATNASWARKTMQAVRDSINTGEVMVFEDGEVVPGPCLETRVVKSTDDEAVCVVRDITARKRAEQRLAEGLEFATRSQQELFEASHRGGGTEVASSVLNIVGDLLNGINLASASAGEILGASPVTGLSKVAKMMRDHNAHLEAFLRQDSKGKRVVPYLEKLAKVLQEENTSVRRELHAIQQHIDHLKEMVSMQKGASGTWGSNKTSPDVMAPSPEQSGSTPTR
jgi:PAS domain S-box-containing protein